VGREVSGVSVPSSSLQVREAGREGGWGDTGTRAGLTLAQKKETGAIERWPVTVH